MFDGLSGLFELLIGAVASAAGGRLGVGIFVVSAATRLLTLPFACRIAIRARARRETLGEMRAELKALQARYDDDPRRLSEEMRALYRARGVSLIDRPALVLSGVQLPLVLALFRAVRGAAGSALSAASLPVSLLAAVAATSAVLAGAQDAPLARTVLFLALASAGTLAFTLTMGSWLGWYSAALGGVSTVQGLVVRRSARRLAPPKTD